MRDLSQQLADNDLLSNNLLADQSTERQGQSFEQEEAVEESTPVSGISLGFETTPLLDSETEQVSTDTSSTAQDTPANTNQSIPGPPPAPEVEEVEPPETEPIPVPPINTENQAEVVNSLDGLPATSFTAGMKKVGEVAPTAQEKEKAHVEASLPEIDQPTGLPIKGSADMPKYVPKKGEVPKLKEKTGGVEQEVPEEHKADLAPLPKQEAPKIKEPEDTGEESWWSRMKNFLERNFKTIKTTDPGVNTSPGTPPKVDTSGEADPAQNEENQVASDQTMDFEQQKADANSTEYRGEEEIFPEVKPEKLSPDVTLQEIPAREQEQSIKEVQLTAEVRTAIDEQAQEKINEEVNPEIEKNQSEYDTYQEDSEKEHQKANDEIASETERIKKEQESEQGEAKKEVNKQREDWKKENEDVRGDYTRDSEEERSKVDADIDTEIETKEGEIKTEYSDAETKAEGEKAQAEKDAKAKEEKERNKPRSFWDKVKGAVADFFDALRKAVNFIFDKMREAVKFIIEQAKKAVNALIDLARKAIVGLIKAFGEALKKLVSVALAAFPEIRDRVLGLIDKAVEVAVDAVNKLAEALKEIANALLDALGAVLDAILAAYQAIYNAIIDVLEFITVGLIRIIEFLSNLVVGSWYAPGEFFGALATEAIGGDPSQPLPNFEVPTGQEAAWAEAMQEPEIAQAADDPGIESGKTEADLNKEAVDTARMSELLQKTELNDNDVTIEPFPAVELDPALQSQLAEMEDGETKELGGAGEEGVSAEQFLQAAAEDSGIDLNAEVEDQARAPQMEGISVDDDSLKNEPTKQGDTKTPDWRNMSDDAKLEHYLGEMLQPTKDAAAEEPAPKKEAKPANDTTLSPEVLITKTGRLDVGSRLAFMGEQMMTGLQIFWNKYKVWIITGLVAALLAAGIIAFFTGGAGLALVVDVVAKALIIIFGAIAVYRAMGKIWDYIKAAWAGDPLKAGKDLASAMAIIVVEFLIDKILLGMGKVFKRIIKAAKNVIRSTKTGRRVLIGATNARRFVNKGLRAGKSVIKKGVVRLKNTKLAIRLRGTVGKGVKRFSKLRDDILERFGFKRMWFEKHGKYIELWGQFNAKVLILREKPDDEHTFSTKEIGPTHRKKIPEGESKIIGTQTSPKGVIASDGYIRHLEDLKANNPSKLQDELSGLKDDLDAGDFEQLRKRVNKGNTKSTAELGRGIEKVDGKIPPDFQRHHIAPEELATDPTFKQFFEDIEFNIQDGSRNGVALPKDQAILDNAIANHGYQHRTPTFHNGSHSAAYKQRITDRVTELVDEFEQLSGQVGKDQAKVIINGKLDTFLQQTKAGLNNGTISLN